MGWLMFSGSHAFFRESKEPLANEYLQVKYFLESNFSWIRARRQRKLRINLGQKI